MTLIDALFLMENKVGARCGPVMSHAPAASPLQFYTTTAANSYFDIHKCGDEVGCWCRYLTVLQKKSWIKVLIWRRYSKLLCYPPQPMTLNMQTKCWHRRWVWDVLHIFKDVDISVISRLTRLKHFILRKTCLATEVCSPISWNQSPLKQLSYSLCLVTIWLSSWLGGH